MDAWIWEDMVVTNNAGKGLDVYLDDGGEWINCPIQWGSLVAVTDGSYIRECCYMLCSDTVILE
jgi:hypothetical protein